MSAPTRQLFGTDGIRGEAPLAPDLDRGKATVLGHAVDGRLVDFEEFLDLMREPVAPMLRAAFRI